MEVAASKPGLMYKLQHPEDGIYSCSCPAWKIQKLPPQVRTCKHLKAHLGEDFESARVNN